VTSFSETALRVATFFLRGSLRSLRVTVLKSGGANVPLTEHQFGNEIYAVRERDLFLLAATTGASPFVTLVAQGRDGDWATVVAEGLGCRVVRGSSRHDPTVSARSLVVALRASATPAVLVVDGPVGPSGIAKPGIGMLAKLTGRPIVAVSAETSAGIVLRGTWSRMVLPLPFSRILIALGEPIRVECNAPREAIDEVAREVSGHFARMQPVSLEAVPATAGLR
jgi:lysophospholipid acyltransferase (LPLAT)-like uncharacterized protein